MGKKEQAARFAAATNGKGNWRGSQWYVLDLLTQEPLEKNPDKGWYNTRRQCLIVCDKLNAVETKAGRRYVELGNGYVRQFNN